MSTTNSSTNNVTVTRLKILGLTSASEAQTIERSLLKIYGVQKASVNLLEEKTIVESDPIKVVVETLIEAVEDVGYGALDLAKPQDDEQGYSLIGG